ncbi:recombinase [Ruminiclostridium sufflavum DSM 19573]|uniref:Recombinase n=1 Tax=Ruminiclostridium sufflavum DSM 19573 TaxID=1121337 RepID=A0A318XM21_9FIRM|nr:recombinase family protein [Ruminiclostridium sufflavum]PYG88772.1 recombinase [Ruminiclostridium sufflavum DSM 19573]
MTTYIDKSNGITEGLRKSFQSTDCKMANRQCYGYDISPNGDLVVNHGEAKVVRWIFERYLVGESFGKIAAGLEQHGVLSPTGKAKWNREAISKLLSNEKYTGSVLLQKTMSICGTQIKNEGELDQMLITHHHDAIISTQDFETVQQMKHERAKAPVQEMKMMLSF